MKLCKKVEGQSQIIFSNYIFQIIYFTTAKKPFIYIHIHSRHSKAICLPNRTFPGINCTTNDYNQHYLCDNVFDGDPITFYHNAGSSDSPWVRGNLGQVFTITRALFVDRGDGVGCESCTNFFCANL